MIPNSDEKKDKTADKDPHQIMVTICSLLVSFLKRLNINPAIFPKQNDRNMYINVIILYNILFVSACYINIFTYLSS